LLKDDVDTRNSYLYDENLYEDGLIRINVLVGMLDIVLSPKQILENYREHLVNRGYEIEYQVKNNETIFDSIKDEIEIMDSVIKYLDAKEIKHYSDEDTNNIYVVLGDVSIKLDNEAITSFYQKYLGLKVKEVRELIEEIKKIDLVTYN